MNKNIKLTCIYLSIFFIFFYILAPQKFSYISFKLVAPIWSFGVSLSEISNSTSNAVLMSQTEELQKEVFALKAKEKENKFYNEISISGVLSDVILRPPKTNYDILIVSHGSLSGIKNSQKVFDKYENYIGYVSSVWNNRSEVTLHSSPNANTNFRVNDFVTEGYGIGSGGVRLEVPEDIDVSAGEAVFVEGFVVGSVVSVEKIDKTTDANVYVSLLANPFLISKVIISNDEI